MIRSPKDDHPGSIIINLIKFKVNKHYYEDANMKRCIRNATYVAHSIIKNILDLPGNYQSTMIRSLTSNGELLFDYLSDNIPISKDSKLKKNYDFLKNIL